MDSQAKTDTHSFADEGASWHPALRPHNDSSTIAAPGLELNSDATSAPLSSDEPVLESQTAEDVLDSTDAWHEEPGLQTSLAQDDVKLDEVHAVSSQHELNSIDIPAIPTISDTYVPETSSSDPIVDLSHSDVRHLDTEDQQPSNDETTRTETPPLIQPTTEESQLAPETPGFIDRSQVEREPHLEYHAENESIVQDTTTQELHGDHENHISHYEHQGDSTEADRAIEEAPTTSLLSHEEEQLEDMAPDAAFRNAPGQELDVSNHLDAHEVAQQDLHATSEEHTHEEELRPMETAGFPEAEHLTDAFDWGTADDEADFANELGFPSQNEPTETASIDISAKDTALAQIPDPTEMPIGTGLEESVKSDVVEQTMVTTEDESKTDDIAALWQAALADDEFLDDQDSVDPSSFFGDDDAGFLEDVSTDKTTQEPPSTPGFTGASPAVSSPSTANKYAPQGSNQAQQPYTAQGAPFYDSSYNPRAASTPSSELPAAFLPPAVAKATRPVGPQSSRSFVDRSRQGYASPYDLPMDIVQPRRRPAAAVMPVASSNAPPLRSSSMTATAPHMPPMGQPSVSSPLSPPFAKPATPSLTSPAPSARPGLAPSAPSSAASGFFADLPMTSRPKFRPAGSTTPVPLAAMPGVQPPPPQGPPSRPPSRPAVPMASLPNTLTYEGLRQPERMPLLPDEHDASQLTQLQYQPAGQAYSGPTSAPLPPASSRFSPMPPAAGPPSSRYSPTSTQGVPSSVNPASRYATASAAQAFPPKAQPFVPKTSSPLAYHEDVARNVQPFSGVRNVDSSSQAAAYGSPSQAVPPKTDYSPVNIPGRVTTPLQASNYAPAFASSPRLDVGASRYAPSQSALPLQNQSPPKRAQTQSPSVTMKGASAFGPRLDRSVSTMEPTAPRMNIVSQSGSQLALPARRRQFSTDLSFSVPQDDRATDPLERWKGCPIFHWAPSGALVSSFPQQAPFYAAGHGIPSIRSTPGPITVHDTKATFPLSDTDAKFPGPLSGKGKGKKKDILAWLGEKVKELETTAESTQQNMDLSQQIKRRTGEKVILWKMMRVLVENDNSLEKPGLEQGLRDILVQAEEVSLPSTEEVAGPVSEIADPAALAEIRRNLLVGDREKAVWLAAERGLWAHAMLIASTLPSQIWKQIGSEFVKAQVKSGGDQMQSLAALYEVFAGNSEESVDQLVPPSARAGFQMVSKRASMGASARNPLEGLDKWSETLALIISNRSNNDGQAIAALGRLLASYGRIEAAHTCFLFAKTFVKHSGADDEEASFVLLGADHKSQNRGLGCDLDAIMLTEVYEYAQSLAPTPGSSPIMPHLQAYKLVHAFELAEHGMRSEAQAYCDSIATAIRSSTRASPYYHPAFTASVEEFSRCLSQAPQTGSGSGWVSKLSSEKVSGSMWKRFNTFVAGEENDSGSNIPGQSSDIQGQAGPFGRVAGDTPAISRVGSQTDMYSAMNGGAAYSAPAVSTSPALYTPFTAMNAGVVKATPQPAGSSRYAPQATNGYTPGRTSLDSTRSTEADRPGTGYMPPSMQRSATTPYGAYMPQAQSQVKPDGLSAASLYAPRPDPSRANSDYAVPYSADSSRRASIQDSYQLQQVSQPSLGQAAIYSSQPLPVMHEPQRPQSEAASRVGIESVYNDSGGYAPPSAGYAPSAVEYEPHAAADEATLTPYEPPSTSYAPSIDASEPPSNTYGSSPAAYEPSLAAYEPPSGSYEAPSTSYEPPIPESDPEASSYGPPTASYEPPSNSYVPDTASFDDGPAQSNGYAPPAASYEPSSYSPYEPNFGAAEAEDETDEPKPKKKSFMDLDDDDDYGMSTNQDASKKAEARAQADREANDAVRKAAEADAARDKAEKEAAAKKGKWFGGWFAGKEKGEEQPKAVRAKLGEESSFYFDKDLNKWVNKKGGAEETVSATTPAPPRGPPSRAVSGIGGPSGPPSRMPSGMGPPISRPATAGPPGSGPPSRVGTPAGDSTSPPPLLNGGLQPPSRPSTGLSQASSIDDLIGMPGAKRGGTAKGKKKGGRYVDVMAK